MAADVIVNGSDVYRLDENAGVWRRIPDVDTANAMGVAWDDLDHEPEIPTPTGDDYVSVTSGSQSGSNTGSVTAPPSGITEGDYGGPSDVSTLSQTPAGQVILIGVGVTPQDVPPISTPSGAPLTIDGVSIGDGGYDVDSNDDDVAFTFGIINRDASGGVTLNGQVGGQITPQGAWKSLIDTLAYDAPSQAMAARASSGRFMDKVGG